MTEKFARYVSVFILMLAVLTIGYGFRISLFANPKQASLIQVTLISDLWRSIVKVAMVLQISKWIVALAYLVIAMAIAMLLTGLFTLMVYAFYYIKYKLTFEETGEWTLHRAKALHSRFVEAEADIILGNKVPNIIFILVAFVMYIYCEAQSMVTFELITDYFMVIMAGLTFTPMLFGAFLLVRSLYITISEWIWRLENFEHREQLDELLKEAIVSLEEKAVEQ